MSGIRLSPKYGVNPSLSVCFFCGGGKNEIVLPGWLRGDAEAPRKAVWHKEPCDECKKFMEQGVMLIRVRDEPASTKPHENPYRLGQIIVVKVDYFQRIRGREQVGSPMWKWANDAMMRRCSFVEDSAWKAFGFPDPAGSSEAKPCQDSP